MSFSFDAVTSQANVPSTRISQLTPLFVTLQVIGGQVGLPLFIGTMLFSKKIKRHLMLVNFCGSWIIYSIVYCLTIYNHRLDDHGAGRRLCIAQAVMVHGVVPLSVTAYCALHLQVWMGLRAPLHEGSWIENYRRAILLTMLFAPYVVFVGFCIASLAVVLRLPETLEHDAYYCTLNFNPLVYAVPGYAAFVIVIMLSLEVVIGVTLVKRWRALRQMRAVSSSNLSMIIRISVFSVYGFATLGACAAFLARSLTAWPYLVQASLPTAIYFAFGTRKDVFQAWMFWRKGRGDHPSQISSNATIGSGRSRPRVIEVHLRSDLEDSVTFPPKAGHVQDLEGIQHET